MINLGLLFFFSSPESLCLSLSLSHLILPSSSLHLFSSAFSVPFSLPLFSSPFHFITPSSLRAVVNFFSSPHNPRTCTADKCFKSVIKIKKVCKASVTFKRRAKTCLSSPSGLHLFGRPRWPLFWLCRSARALGVFLPATLRKRRLCPAVRS